MWRRRPPNELTPREREVLEFLRLGLTNEEVAQRLDISVAGAKYHVSAILSKLGVATREEAAALSLDKRRRWWSGWPLWARVVGTAAVAVSFVVFASAVMHSGREQEIVVEPLSAQYHQCEWSQYDRPGDVSVDVFEKCGVDFLFPNRREETCVWEVIQNYEIVGSWSLESRECTDPWRVLPEGQLASIAVTGHYSCARELIDQNGESHIEPMHPAECDDGPLASVGP